MKNHGLEKTQRDVKHHGICGVPSLRGVFQRSKTSFAAAATLPFLLDVAFQRTVAALPFLLDLASLLSAETPRFQAPLSNAAFERRSTLFFQQTMGCPSTGTLRVDGRLSTGTLPMDGRLSTGTLPMDGCLSTGTLPVRTPLSNAAFERRRTLFFSKPWAVCPQAHCVWMAV